jgi:hypothetical protein
VAKMILIVKGPEFSAKAVLERLGEPESVAGSDDFVAHGKEFSVALARKLGADEMLFVINFGSLQAANKVGALCAKWLGQGAFEPPYPQGTLLFYN